MPFTDSTGQTYGSTQLKPIPPPGEGTATDLQSVLFQRLPWNSLIRMLDISRWRRAELFDQGSQWLRSVWGVYGSRYGSSWYDISMAPSASDAWYGPYTVPMPVFNEGIGPRMNESARLGRPEYQPRVIPKGTNPDFRARRGAKKAEAVLKSEQMRMGWDRTFDQFCYQLPLYGTSFVRSGWEETYDNVDFIPVTTAMACPNHPAIVSQKPQQIADINMPAAEGVKVYPNPLQDAGAKTATFQPPRVEAAVPGAPGTLSQAQIELSTSLPGSPEALALGQETGQGSPGQPGAQPCGFVVSNQKLTRKHLATRPDLMGSVEDSGGDDFVVGKCPVCPGNPDLVPFSPTKSEAKMQPDAFGRPLGKMQPIGQWDVRLGTPYNVYPKNLGIDVDFSQGLDAWVESHIEDMQWYEMRWPHLMKTPDGQPQIQPESPAQLMMYHPIAGSPVIYTTGSDAKLFQNHSRCNELHQKPWNAWDENEKLYKMNRGRSVVMTGLVVLLDGDYMIPSATKPGEYVERAIMEVFQWEHRDGARRSSGIGLWDLMFDACEVSNEIRSQIQAVRQRCAVPMYVHRRGMNLQSASFRSGLPGVWMEIDTDVLAPNAVPEMFNNTTIDAGVINELNDAAGFPTRVSGFTEVEQGRLPPNIAAATAISLLKDESGERRRARILRIKNGLIRIWSHGLRLVEALWLEPRPYRFEKPDGQQAWDYMHGLELEGLTDVEIAPEPAFDTPDARREGIRDAIQLKVLNPQNPQQVRQIAADLGVPDDYFAAEDQQDSAAFQEFWAFMHEGKVPEVDPEIDEVAAHVQSHTNSCYDDEFLELSEKGRWREALAILSATWDEDIQQALAPASPMMIQGPMGPMPAPPEMQPPPPPFTKTVQARIFDMWVQKLQQAGHSAFQSMDPDVQKALTQVLAWRAHLSSHYVKLKMAQQAQQAAQAQAHASAPSQPPPQ